VTSQDDLERLIPAPVRRVPLPEWDSVEAALGVRLPSDYKWLVERYGPGSFDEFLHIFQPASSVEPVQLELQTREAAWALDYLRRGGEVIPYENSELLPSCRTDNGDTGYWLRHPADNPEAWTIVVNEARGTRWSTFDGGIVSFLVAVLAGTHDVSVFPDDFPSEHPKFVAY
jgi:hypothetical protein